MSNARLIGWPSGSRRLLRLLLAGSTVVFLFTAGAESAMAQTAPTAILQQYAGSRLAWLSAVQAAANRLFGLLALIEFAWTAAVLVLEKTDFQGWTAALVRKMMWVGAFYSLLLNGANWIPRIIDSFEILGQQASGAGPMSPGSVFTQGLNIAAALLEGASNAGFMTNFGTAIALVLAALLAFLSFVAVTINFVVAIVESYIVVAAGFIFLGFGGSRWTAPYVERYIGLAVGSGVKIMILYLLVGVGMQLSNGWLAAAQAVPTAPVPAMSAWEIMGASLIFTCLCWQAPKVISGVMGGSPALTGGDLAGTAGTLAAGGAAVAGLAAGGVGLLAGGSAAAASGSGGGAMGVSQAAGMSSGSSAAGAAGSAGTARAAAASAAGGPAGGISTGGVAGGSAAEATVASARSTDQPAAPQLVTPAPGPDTIPSAGPAQAGASTSASSSHGSASSSGASASRAEPAAGPSSSHSGGTSAPHTSVPPMSGGERAEASSAGTTPPASRSDWRQRVQQASDRTGKGLGSASRRIVAAQHALPSDAAPPAPPPPLNTAGGDDGD